MPFSIPFSIPFRSCSFGIYFKNHGKYKIYRNILTESQIKQTLSHLEYPRLTG
jgi:hypothetical protein